MLRELGIQIDFQNNSIRWDDINLPMKPIDCKMRTHFTINDRKYIRNTTKRIKKILNAKYKKDNSNKIVNHKKYLNNDKQSTILKLLRKHEKFLKKIVF